MKQERIAELEAAIASCFQPRVKDRIEWIRESVEPAFYEENGK